MKRLAVLVILGFLAFGNAASWAAQWRVGTARTEITPTTLLWMAGYAARQHPAEGTLHPLWAKALVIDDQRGGRVAIITTDLIGDDFQRELSNSVAAGVTRLTGIERQNIVLSFSHTHCGPVTWTGGGALVTYGGMNAQQQADVNAYTEILKDKLAQLVADACENMRPAALAFAEGKATFARNRRQPEGPVDHAVPVLRVSDEQDRLLAVLFGYACHNTTLGGDYYQYNGDYAGFAQIALESALPESQAMFMSGCGADINPAPRGQVELAQQHGRALADAVRRVLDAKLQPVRGPLTAALERVELPFVDPPTKSDLERRRGEGDVYNQRLTEVLLGRIAEHGSLESSYPCPIQVVRFGDDLSLIALPGEPVIDLALRLRKEFSGRQIWVAGYCNEVFAYIPSERVLAEGGYEGGGAMRYFGWHGPFQPGVEDRVVGLVKRLMAQ